MTRDGAAAEAETEDIFGAVPGNEGGTGMFYTIGGITGAYALFVIEAYGTPTVSTFFITVTILSDEGLHSPSLFSSKAVF